MAITLKNIGNKKYLVYSFLNFNSGFVQNPYDRDSVQNIVRNVDGFRPKLFFNIALI
jgi:hypothetical protein